MWATRESTWNGVGERGFYLISFFSVHIEKSRPLDVRCLKIFWESNEEIKIGILEIFNKTKTRKIVNITKLKLKYAVHVTRVIFRRNNEMHFMHLWKRKGRRVAQT